jgi:hypothetical protein
MVVVTFLMPGSMCGLDVLGSADGSTEGGAVGMDVVAGVGAVVVAGIPVIIVMRFVETGDARLAVFEVGAATENDGKHQTSDQSEKFAEHGVSSAKRGMDESTGKGCKGCAEAI